MRSSVHTEVNLGEKGENFLIDIGIFKEGVRGEIENGTKRFEPRSLEYALEIKFIKNKNNVSYHYFHRELWKFREKICPSTGKYLAVFSNKNPFKGRSSEGQEAKRMLMEQAENLDFDLYHFHPKGYFSN